MRSGVVVQSRNGPMEWVAPIPYGSVVFHGAGLFPNAGTFYHDASARKNNGTLVNGPTWQWVQELGRWGILLNGTNQNIAFPVVNLGVQNTLCAWINGPSASNDTLFGGLVDQQYFYRYARSPMQWLYTTAWGNGATLNYTVASGVWTHIALVRIDRGIYLYANGAYIGTANLTSDTATSVRYIGQRDNMLYWDGIVADEVICNAALSPPQIQWLANRANNPWQPWRRKSWPVSGGAAPTGNRSRRLLLAGAY